MTPKQTCGGCKSFSNIPTGFECGWRFPVGTLPMWADANKSRAPRSAQPFGWMVEPDTDATNCECYEERNDKDMH